jgi:hypothetical protein
LVVKLPLERPKLCRVKPDRADLVDLVDHNHRIVARAIQGISACRIAAISSARCALVGWIARTCCRPFSCLRASWLRWASPEALFRRVAKACARSRIRRQSRWLGRQALASPPQSVHGTAAWTSATPSPCAFRRSLLRKSFRCCSIFRGEVSRSKRRSVKRRGRGRVDGRGNGGQWSCDGSDGWCVCAFSGEITESTRGFCGRRQLGVVTFRQSIL